MLRGQKTSIRSLEEDDAKYLYTWYNNQDVNLWSTGAWPLGTMFSMQDIVERFIEPDPDCPRYAVLAESGQLIGTIGFRELNLPARSATVFITIGDQAHWDHGYGTDALITFARFLFTQWNLHRLSLDTWDGNVRALKAYEKVGFQIEGRLREARYVLGEYRDAIQLGLLRDEFLALHPALAQTIY